MPMSNVREPAVLGALNLLGNHHARALVCPEMRDPREWHDNVIPGCES